MKKELCINRKNYSGSYRNGRLSLESQKRVWDRQLGIIKKEPIYKAPESIRKHEHRGEIDFIKTFFSHTNWIHQPGMFRLDQGKYSPDFYDCERNVFIEVSATKQAYSRNKDKYALFRKSFPKINFEIRKPDGTLLDESISINAQLLEFKQN